MPLHDMLLVEYTLRYPHCSPATEVAGYSCEARLRGLDQAIPDDLRKKG